MTTEEKRRRVLVLVDMIPSLDIEEDVGAAIDEIRMLLIPEEPSLAVIQNRVARYFWAYQQNYSIRPVTIR